MRLGIHKKYTVRSTGPHERSEKPSPYLPLSPEKIQKKKKKTSKHQSVSLVTPEAQIRVFGHNRDRSDKLAGVLMDADDAMINRMFIYDGGTIQRPYESDTQEEALKYFQTKTNPNNPILFSTMDDFEEAVAKQKDNYNEVLARIKWDISSCAIGVFSDNFEARCIAQFYARRMRDRLKEQYREQGKYLDDSYQVPIIYYMPGNNKTVAAAT